MSTTPITVASGEYIIAKPVTRIPDEHLRKPCPDGPNYRTDGTGRVEQWVPGTGWVEVKA